MTTLCYAPEFDHVWIECSFDEAEKNLLSFMEKESIIDYLRMKNRYAQKEQSEEYVKGIKDLYGLNDIPEVFAIITRDMKVTVKGDPYFPYCALVPDGTFEICDHIQLDSPRQMKRLCVTHDNGEPFPNQPAKRKLYFDLDGTLVDFKSGIDKVNPDILEQHKGHPEDIEGIFSLMDPMPGAIEAVDQLKDIYDCYILSTVPWDNPSAWSDKLQWVQKHLGQTFYKKLILTHHKELLNDKDSLLIDDRKTHGADSFGINLIEFKRNWFEIIDILQNKAFEEGLGLRN